MQFGGALGTRSWILVGRRKKTDMSGWGWTLAASTSEAAQSYRRPSIRCIAGVQMPRHAMRIFMTSMALPCPLTLTVVSQSWQLKKPAGSSMPSADGTQRSTLITLLQFFLPERRAFVKKVCSLGTILDALPFPSLYGVCYRFVH